MNSQLFFIVNAGFKETKFWKNSDNSLFKGSMKFDVPKVLTEIFFFQFH